MRSKAIVEQAIADLDYPYYSVFRPGLLLNRDNDYRMAEKVAAIIPFYPKNQSRDVGVTMLERAIDASLNRKEEKFKEVLGYKEIKNLATL